MKLLDCETVDTIYSSIEQISGLNKDTLIDVLLHVTEDELYPGHISPDKILLKKLQRETNSICKPDAICWFHLTRTVQNNPFEEGILPLSQILDHLWRLLFSLVQDQISSEQWREFQSKVRTGKLNHSARLYQMKTSSSQHWGLYATLIRDFAFKANGLPIHDYLRVPEIVEDIAICFEKLFGIDLLKRFSTATSPCIVKFLDYESRPDTVGVALHYLHVQIHNGELSIMCNTNIDKRGAPIHRDQIIKVEFPEYRLPESA